MFNIANVYNVNDVVPWSLFGFLALGGILLVVVVIGVLILKGYALWTAARRGEKGWFIALLVVNTMGILELVYLYFVADVWNKKGMK